MILFNYFFKEYKSFFACQILKSDKPVVFMAFVLFCIFIWSPLSHSAKVHGISVKGNKIIETDLIRSHIKLKVGSFYSEKTIQKDVRQLFSLGFF